MRPIFSIDVEEDYADEEIDEIDEDIDGGLVGDAVWAWVTGRKMRCRGS